VALARSVRVPGVRAALSGVLGSASAGHGAPDGIDRRNRCAKHVGRGGAVENFTLKVTGAAICGTGLPIPEGDFSTSSPGRIPGQEGLSLGREEGAGAHVQHILHERRQQLHVFAIDPFGRPNSRDFPLWCPIC